MELNFADFQKLMSSIEKLSALTEDKGFLERELDSIWQKIVSVELAKSETEKRLKFYEDAKSEFCTRCKRNTFHGLINRREATTKFEDITPYEIEVNESYECLGCKMVLHKRRTLDSAGNVLLEISSSESSALQIAANEQLASIDDKIHATYLDVIEFFNARKFRYCLNAIARIISELRQTEVIKKIAKEAEIDIEKNDEYTIEKAIDLMVKNGFIGEKSAEILYNFHFLDEKATDDTDVNNEEQIIIALIITENILINLLVIQPLFEKMKIKSKKNRPR